MADRYAVMGNPIAHSKSPRIHALFAEQTGQDIAYEAILVPEDGLGEAVAEFHAAGGKGLNITVPFKQKAWLLAEARSPRADRAGAVNTLWWREDGSLFGDNTDGVGLVRDLRENHGAELGGRRILLLGAGGAAHAVLPALLETGPALLVVANRTADKAVQLADRFADLGPVEGCGFPRLAGRTFDVIINATAAGIDGTVPEVPTEVVTADTLCYDMMYGDAPTAFVRWAAAAGAGQAFDGLGMLVEQAAESFFLWRGVRPETAPVIRALRGRT